jgi:hypothetical protein
MQIVGFMMSDYTQRLEEENTKLREVINSLEDDNKLCKMWKPCWRNTVAGMELCIGKGTPIGEVMLHPTSNKWWAHVLGRIISNDCVGRKEAKQLVVDTILNGNYSDY